MSDTFSLPKFKLEDLTIDQLEYNIALYAAIIPLMEMAEFQLPNEHNEKIVREWKEDKRLMEQELLERTLLQKT